MCLDKDLSVNQLIVHFNIHLVLARAADTTQICIVNTLQIQQTLLTLVDR